MSMSELTAFAQRGHEPPDVIVIAGGGEVQQPTQEAPEHRLRANGTATFGLEVVGWLG